MKRLFVLGIVAMLCAGSACGQDATPKAVSEALKPDKFGIVGGFGLLTQSSVQQDLKLSDDQIQKLEAYQAQQRELYQGLGSLDPNERAKKLSRASVEGERIISETLKPEQIKRFLEITRQQDGLRLSAGAKDGHVTGDLQLTDDQKQQLKTIVEEIREASKAAGGDRNKLQELLKGGNEKVMALLSEEQRTKWKELIGEPLQAASSLSPGEPRSAASTAGQETRYLAFQVFTNYTSDPKDAQALNNGMREPLVPGTGALRDYVLDIKQRIGINGDAQTRLAMMLGPLCFDQTDAEITQFIERAVDLALETDLAVGFHIDDCIFWTSRKDLWSDPQNVEALDWDGTPCTSRRLNYGTKPIEAPPQMCFNSKAVQYEVRKRAALIGKAIAAGVKKLEQRNRPEMFAGVISGWETQMGQDLKTGKYLGYRALLNRGFSRERPPEDQSLELEKVTQEFIELWTSGLAEAGAPPKKIYSHIAFLSRRAFGMGDNKAITYMQRDKGAAYSQHNHYTPPSVAFGKSHRPGFSTYPQPGLFDDIYEQVNKHTQVGWASCEGTNLQPMSGPGQTGMNMETYLAKMFNHGATLTTIFSWGIGGEAHKTMSFRVDTENEDALGAYRKFLRGEPLIEAKETMSLMERLPLKVQTIQKELPAWMQKADPEAREKANALLQKLQEQAKGKDPQALEQTADALLKMIGVSIPGTGAQTTPQPATPPSASPSSPSDGTGKRIMEKVGRVKEGYQKWTASGRDASAIHKAMDEKFRPLMDAGKVVEAEAELDRVLEQLNKDAN